MSDGAALHTTVVFLSPSSLITVVQWNDYYNNHNINAVFAILWLHYVLCRKQYSGNIVEMHSSNDQVATK